MSILKTPVNQGGLVYKKANPCSDNAGFRAEKTHQGIMNVNLFKIKPNDLSNKPYPPKFFCIQPKMILLSLQD